MNVTIDDQNSAIMYSPPGAWAVSLPSSLDYGGSHTYAKNQPDATATFHFTGIAIYFLSPLWPYAVNTVISLDGSPGTLIDLTDPNMVSPNGGPETVKSRVVWGATNLDNKQHVLTVSVGAGQIYADVDGLVYTVLDSISPTSPVPLASTPAAPLPSPSPPSTSGAHSPSPATPSTPRASSSASLTLTSSVVKNSTINHVMSTMPPPPTPLSTTVQPSGVETHLAVILGCSGAAILAVIAVAIFFVRHRLDRRKYDVESSASSSIEPFQHSHLSPPVDPHRKGAQVQEQLNPETIEIDAPPSYLTVTHNR